MSDLVFNNLCQGKQMKLIKTSLLSIALMISLLSQTAPAKATVIDDLKALNDEAKELASKIKQGCAARDNAHAAGELKLACDFHAFITLTIADLMKVHSKKAEIFKSRGMSESQKKELKALATLDQIGELEYAEFNKRCR